MINASTIIFPALFGLLVWYVGESSGPVAAAVVGGMTSVGAAFHNEGKIKELERRLEDLTRRLQHLMKDD